MDTSHYTHYSLVSLKNRQKALVPIILPFLILYVLKFILYVWYGSTVWLTRPYSSLINYPFFSQLFKHSLNNYCPVAQNDVSNWDHILISNTLGPPISSPFPLATLFYLNFSFQHLIQFLSNCIIFLGVILSCWLVLLRRYFH